MRIATALFTNEESENYERFVPVLARTAAIHCPGAEFRVHRSEGVDEQVKKTGKDRKWVFVRNAEKTRIHNEIVHAADDGECLCLIDADTMILRDLSPVWLQPFDLAYTVKPPEAEYCVNSGVVFVRVSPITKAFYAAWYETVLRMLTDEPLHRQWKKRWGGINQAALGWMLSNSCGLRTAELPCEVWNCCKEGWGDAIGRARVVHLLEPLKKACVKNAGTNGAIGELAKLWQEHERAAQST